MDTQGNKEANERIRQAAQDKSNDGTETIREAVIIETNFFKSLSRTTIAISSAILGAAAGAGTMYVIGRKNGSSVNVGTPDATVTM